MKREVSRTRNSQLTRFSFWVPQTVTLTVDLDQFGLLPEAIRAGIVTLVEAHDDRLRYSPRSAVTPDLADRMKAHKGELLAMLYGDLITPETRRQVYASMIERVNAAYHGGSIDWTRLDDIEKRIWTAETMGELLQSSAEYEKAAQEKIDTGHQDQYM